MNTKDHETPSGNSYRLCRCQLGGFTIEHPSHWLLYPYNLLDALTNPYSSLGLMKIYSRGDPVSGPDESSPGIFLLVQRMTIQNIPSFYKQFLPDRLLWSRVRRLSSGEDALEYSFEFVRELKDLRKALAVIVAKDNVLYRVSGDCRKSEFQEQEETFRKVLRSLTLIPLIGPWARMNAQPMTLSDEDKPRP